MRHLQSAISLGEPVDTVKNLDSELYYYIQKYDRVSSLHFEWIEEVLERLEQDSTNLGQVFVNTKFLTDFSA